VKRRFFSILFALSLLLFVAACAMWVRSYWWCGEWIVYQFPTHDFRL
jgi:hypothetical protein